MADDSPTPSTTLPPEVVEILEDATPTRLRAIAEYADALAEHADERRYGTKSLDASGDESSPGDGGDRPDEGTAEPLEGSTEEQPETSTEEQPENVTGEQLAQRPESVPAKASTTVKEINGNRYYYWQWRDGDRIRSQYKGPVKSENES